MITIIKAMQKTDWIKALFFSSIFFNPIFYLTGCTTAGDAIPQGGPTMAQVYEQAMEKSNGATLDQARQQVNATAPVAYNGANQLSPYTRTSENEINNLFPTLPNPQLVMFVYPHLAGQDDAPIPGYSTAFNLFKREHYAMAGETA
jgi:conjugative transfer region lipoprotein (TIGR03751 family)